MWCIQGTQTSKLLSCTFNKDIQPLSPLRLPAEHLWRVADMHTVAQPGDETLLAHSWCFRQDTLFISLIYAIYLSSIFLPGNEIWGECVCLCWNHIVLEVYYCRCKAKRAVLARRNGAFSASD